VFAEKEVCDERNEEDSRVFQQEGDSDGKQVNRFCIGRLQQSDANHSHRDEGHNLFSINAKGAGVPYEHDGAHEHCGTDDTKEGDLEPVNTRAVHQQLDDDAVDAKNKGGDRSGNVPDQCAGFGYSH
jgi:hypothetical protein